MKGRSDLYARNDSLPRYLEYLRSAHPALHGLLSHERCCDAERQVATMNTTSWEFEDEQVGGRGSAYNVAQRHADNRTVGMTALLRCFGSGFGLLDQTFRILDVLGGDGTFARFCQGLGRHAPTIYTADISRFMIDACDAQGLPCVRQAATRSLFRDGVLDGVLIAYGSHHLDASARWLAVREAYRTLRPGGHLVLHDFEIGGACAQWFDTVVNPYSRTGHPHKHFSRQEMLELLHGTGFRDVRVFEIRDPFTLHGSSAERARRHAIMHMYDMYDLIKIADAPRDVVPVVERHITETLGPISIWRDDDRYVAEIPRTALVAVGSKAMTSAEGGP
jgi:SAM-dependent methyltransferase